MRLSLARQRVVSPAARIPDHSADDPPRAVYELAVQPHQLLRTQTVDSVVIEVGETRPTFLVAEWVEYKPICPGLTLAGLSRPAPSSLTRTGLVLRGGLTLAVPDALVTDVQLPALDSSLLAYTVNVDDATCPTALFRPALRASTSPPHESQYFPAVGRAHVYQHASAPFLSPYASGLRLTLWRDPTCETAPRIRLRVDWARSVGEVVLRYRFALISWPVVIAALVLGRQLSDFHGGRAWPTTAILLNSAGAFPSPAETLGRVCKDTLPIVLAVATAASAAQVVVLGRTESDWGRNILLGTRHWLFVPLVPLFIVVAVGVYAVFVLGVQLLVAGLAAAWGVVARADDKAEEGPSRPHWLGLAVLVAFVVFVAPQQFAFLVVCIVQLLSTVQSLVHARRIHVRHLVTATLTPQTSRAWDAHQHSFSTLIILLGLLPINGAVLVIWARNLLAGWYAPFSSDHNPLAVAGFLAFAEATHRRSPSRQAAYGYAASSDEPSDRCRRWQGGACAVASIWMLLFGVRHVYVCYRSLNLVYAILAVHAMR